MRNTFLSRIFLCLFTLFALAGHQVGIACSLDLLACSTSTDCCVVCDAPLHSGEDLQSTAPPEFEELFLSLRDCQELVSEPEQTGELQFSSFLFVPGRFRGFTRPPHRGPPLFAMLS